MARNTAPFRKPGSTDLRSVDKRPGKPVDTSELERRVERLEERIEASILGEDGLAELDKGIDKTPSGNPLEKAVRRSNIRRGSRKA